MKSDLVAKRVLGTLTDRRHNRDPPGQKDFLHPLRYHPVKVIDILRSTRVLPVIVVPVCGEWNINKKLHHSKTGASMHSSGLH